MTLGRIEQDVGAYYARALEEHGPTARGVDWSTAASQELRFVQLCRLVDGGDGSILDFGCGYGALLDHLRQRGWRGQYTGIDLAPSMLDAARRVHPDDGDFVAELPAGARFDYVVASGIFNVRLTHTAAEWDAYVRRTLTTIDGLAQRGWAVNLLTRYSDPDRMRDDLFYADPGAYLDLCMTTYSRKVAILHDYELYEFTLLVRR